MPPPNRLSLPLLLRRFNSSPPAHPTAGIRHRPPLAAAISLACRFRSRSVIRFSGPDTVKFLQGLLTNDVRPFALPPAEGSSYIPTPNVPSRTTPPIYAAMLTPQGRFLYDLFLYRAPHHHEKLNRFGSGPGANGADEEVPAVFADVDASLLDELLDCFRKYRLRSKVQIENVSEDYSCWQRFGGGLAVHGSPVQEPEAASVGWGNEVDHLAESAAQGNNLGWQWFRDPRVNCLGFRGIFPSDTVPPLVEANKEADELHFCQWRLERGVAEGAEIPKGEAIPLEYNLVGLNAISFDKGCYVGQELVARTHHRGVIRKRLVPFKFVDRNGEEVEGSVSLGSAIVDSSHKKVGAADQIIGSSGMGLLKLEAFASVELGIEGSDVRVKIMKPDWWPAEWLQVHDLKHTVS